MKQTQRLARQKLRRNANRFRCTLKRSHWTLTGGPYIVEDYPDLAHVKSLMVDWCRVRADLPAAALLRNCRGATPELFTERPDYISKLLTFARAYGVGDTWMLYGP